MFQMHARSCMAMTYELVIDVGYLILVDTYI